MKFVQAFPSQEHIPATDVSGLRTAMLLLLSVAFLRCPSILIHGRMWGEELPVFLASNWNRSFLFALRAQHFGYFSIWDNFLGAVAVHWIPLAWVALLFSWSGVVMLLLTGYLVYQAEFLTTPTAKLLGVAALLFTAPSVETWINLLNSEFFFGIWSAVILFSEATRLRVYRSAALILAVLSGPLTTLLAPLFVLRAFVTRRRGSAWQAAIVSTGGLFQIAVAKMSAIAGRQIHANPLTVVPALFDKEFVELFLSRMAAKGNMLLLRDHLHYGEAASMFCFVGLLLCLGGLVYLVCREAVPLWLVLTAFWMAVIEAMLAIGGGWSLLESGERYSFLPNYLIELALIVMAVGALRDVRRTSARILLALAFLSGVADYVLLPIRFREDWQGEPWRAQALRWERDPDTALHTHPAASWPAFKLPPRQ